MGKTILVIEEEKLQRRLVRTLLEGCGYRVLTADTGEEALCLARRVSPDLVILEEWNLDQPAEGLIQCLRRELRGELRVLLRSACEPWRLRQLAVRTRADDWVHKLDSNRVLLECVDQLTRPHPRLSRLPLEPEEAQDPVNSDAPGGRG